jgi:hypothetical protein
MFFLYERSFLNSNIFFRFCFFFLFQCFFYNNTFLSFEDKMNKLSAITFRSLSRVTFPLGFQSKEDINNASPYVALARTSGLILSSVIMLNKMKDFSGLPGMKYDEKNTDYYFNYASRKFLLTAVTLGSLFKMPFIESYAKDPDNSILSQINGFLYTFFNKKKTNNAQLAFLGISLLLFYVSNIKYVKLLDLEKEKHTFEFLKSEKNGIFETYQSKQISFYHEDKKELERQKKKIEALEEKIQKKISSQDFQKVSFIKKYLLFIDIGLFKTAVFDLKKEIDDYASSSIPLSGFPS